MVSKLSTYSVVGSSHVEETHFIQPTLEEDFRARVQI